MRLIDRLSKYLSSKGVTAYEFERSCNIANGYLGKQLKGKGSVGSDILEKVSREYPDLNLVWLITGEGRMIVNRKKQKPAGEENDLEMQDHEAVYDARNKLIKVLKEQIEVLSSSVPGKKKRKTKGGSL
ncbi:MAG: hypothetical protein ABW019_07950 [Chitinophagaceae bacterium]